jgi:hypothetical protein
MILCPRCNASCGDTERHCSKCGARLAGQPIQSFSLFPTQEQADRVALLHRKQRHQRLLLLFIIMPSVQFLLALMVGRIETWHLVLYPLASVLLIFLLMRMRWSHLTAIVCQGLIAFPLGFWSCTYSISWFFLVLSLLCAAAITLLWVRSINDLT